MQIIEVVEPALMKDFFGDLSLAELTVIGLPGVARAILVMLFNILFPLQPSLQAVRVNVLHGPRAPARAQKWILILIIVISLLSKAYSARIALRIVIGIDLNLHVFIGHEFVFYVIYVANSRTIMECLLPFTLSMFIRRHALISNALLKLLVFFNVAIGIAHVRRGELVMLVVVVVIALMLPPSLIAIIENKFMNQMLRVQLRKLVIIASVDHVRLSLIVLGHNLW